MSDYRIRISDGNRKMGGVPSVSFPPVITCGARIPCARLCYVVRNMIAGPYGKQIAASYAANLEFFNADRAAFFDALARYLERRAPRFFRFHVSGDWTDADHLRRAFETARAFPDVRFLAFSKRFDLFPAARTVPRNFALIASLWPKWGTRPAGYRAAFMQTPDGAETRVTRGALECPGNCETCGACWNLRKLRRDVVFMQH